jgi:hypothetical protein
MRLCARRFRGSVLVAVLAFGGGAIAQELQLDPKALDTGSASSVQTKRAKGKKGAEAAAQPVSGKPSTPAGGPNRQFGELEGWSPGKAPPKPKDREDSSGSSTKPPVTVSPSGNMGTGFAF